MSETLNLFIDNDGSVFRIDPDTGRRTPLPAADASRLSGGPQPQQNSGGDPGQPPPLVDSGMLQRGASMAGFGTVATAIARFAAVAGLVDEIRKRVEANIAAQKKLSESRAQEIAAQQEAQRTQKERQADTVKRSIQRRINNAPITSDVDISADEDNAIRRDLKDKFNKKAKSRDAKRNKKRSGTSSNPASAKAVGSTVSKGAKSAGKAAGSAANAAASAGARTATAGASAAEGVGAIAGAEGLLALAGPVGAVVGALAAAGTALYAFKKGVDATVDSLAKYTSRTSAAIAQANVKNVIQDVQHAQVLDSDMARFVEVQNEISMLLKTIWRGIMKWGLDALLPIVEAMAAIAKQVFELAVNTIASIPDTIGKTAITILEHVSPIAAALIKIAENIRDLKDTDPVGMDPLIDALTGTLVPMHPANAANQAQGAFVVGSNAGNGNRRRLMSK